MENVFIEFLPPWVETNLQPAFYDKESGTVLQQTARMYAKVNELTASQNEVLDKFAELYTYTHDYFDNLDLQEEVNNKLDEMAEGGQLADIIAAYLNSNAILAFDTVDDLEDAENIVDGSFARTYGKDTYDDGKGAFYKVREIRNTDVIDGDNIVALPDVTLVAEKMPDYNITTLQNSINTVQNNVQLINNSLSYDYTIFIGDSYLKNPSTSENWGTYVRDYLGLSHVYINAVAGSCFSGGANGNLMKFKTQLETVASGLSAEEKSQINNIIVGGGFNDRGVAEDTILQYIEEFMTYAKTTFPNAKVYLAMMGYTLDRTTTDLGLAGGYVYNLRNVLPAYSKCALYGMNFLCGVQYVMHKSNYFNADLVHPNQLGSKMLATAIINCLETGSYNVYDFGYFDGFIDPSDSIDITNTSFACMQNDNIEININNMDVKFDSTVSLNGGTAYEIGKIDTTSDKGYSYGGGAKYVACNSVDCCGLDVTNSTPIAGNLYVQDYSLYFKPKQTIANTRRIIFYGNIVINCKTNLF